MRSCIKSRMKEYKHQFVLFCFLGKEKDGFTIDKRLYNGIDGHSFFFMKIHWSEPSFSCAKAHHGEVKHIGPLRHTDKTRQTRQTGRFREYSPLTSSSQKKVIMKKPRWDLVDHHHHQQWLGLHSCNLIHGSCHMPMSTTFHAFDKYIGPCCSQLCNYMNDFEQVRGSWRKICCCGIELSISKIPSP